MLPVVQRWQDQDGCHVSVSTGTEREVVLFLTPEQAEAVEKAIKLALIGGVEHVNEVLRRAGAPEDT